ncbi:MAG: hypothetical protein GYB35_04410 [Algicola sp.]|nr:hypothetical protein [Algicola sp.]
MNLIDNWEGYYEYGEGYTLPQFGERVNILVNLQGSNESFIGTVKEEKSDYSVPADATIKGFSENEFISFVKKYPVHPRLKTLGGSEIIVENGQLEIEHYGYIDPKFDAIYGTWSITEKNASNIDFEPETVFGTWLLRRVK